MLPPLYRALCEAALRRDGVLEPSVNAVGAFRDGSSDLLQAEDGVALILQALAFADAATGARIGAEFVKALAKQTRLDALESAYEVQCRDCHANSADLIDAVHDAALALVAQHSIKAQ